MIVQAYVNCRAMGMLLGPRQICGSGPNLSACFQASKLPTQQQRAVLKLAATQPAPA